MMKIILCLWLFSVQLILPVIGQSYNEKHRLQLHYSLPTGWSNDPNGLIYANDLYHLFYQHNPKDVVFGPMHWGHAQSTDLIHWENQPIAIYPSEKGVIFSGCCILDSDNLTGVAPDGTDEVPLIAIFTLNSETESQSQGMAFSLDKGVTFNHFAGNPIIPNQGIPDFRDPNIFIRDGLFYMVLAVNDRLQFFRSENLLDWSYVNDFGVLPNEGDKSGVWECPSLVTLKDEQNNAHDVLIISLNNGVIHTGQTQYFIGEFNGTAFNSYNKTRVLRADNGFDNYAGIPYYNEPLGRVILIGWLSNWLYANAIPTSKWRGQMTIPRELALQTVDDQLHLIQQPIDALNTLIDDTRTWSLTTPVEISGQQIVDLNTYIPFKTGSMLLFEYTLDIQNAANGKVGLQFGNELGEFISFDYFIDENVYELNRNRSGDISFSPSFADQTARADRISTSSLLTGKIILDTAAIEIFADDGLNTFSAIFFPTELYEKIQINVVLEDAHLVKSIVVQKCSVAALNGIWPK